MLTVRNVSRKYKHDLIVRFAKAVRKEKKTYEQLKDIYDRTHLDGDSGEWGLFILRAKQSMQGHIEADVINKAKFEIV